VSHGVGQAEDAGTDHGGDAVEGCVPPLGGARGGLVGSGHLKEIKQI